MSLRSELWCYDVLCDFRIKRCSVRLCLQWFVGVSCLLYVICVCLRIVVSRAYCVVFLSCFSSSCMLPVSMDCPCSISPSVFSNVYSDSRTTNSHNTCWNSQQHDWCSTDSEKLVLERTDHLSIISGHNARHTHMNGNHSPDFFRQTSLLFHKWLPERFNLDDAWIVNVGYKNTSVSKGRII